MLYYKVKEGKGNIAMYKNKKVYSHTVENELLTEKELNKYNFTHFGINEIYDKIETSSRDTYFFFGARFLKRPTLEMFKKDLKRRKGHILQIITTADGKKMIYYREYNSLVTTIKTKIF